ncbi:MAG: hypothetical protein WCA77_05045 [Thermoplasmata archaeon]
MAPPLPPFNATVLAYAMVAGFMVVANIYVLARAFPRRGDPPTYATVILLLGLLLVACGLWLSVVYAIVSPSASSLTVFFLMTNAMMGVAGAWIMGLFFRAEERIVRRASWAWPLTVAFLVLVNELLMGVAFVLALGQGPTTVATWSNVVTAASAGVNSVWFFWAMFATMAFLVLWLPLTRPEQVILLGFSGTALVGPWVVNDPVVGAVAMGSVMAVVLFTLVWQLRGEVSSRVEYLRVGMGIAAGFAVMAGGELLFLGGTFGQWGSFPFALASLLVMGGEVFLLGRWANRHGHVARTTASVTSIGHAEEIASLD